MLDKLIPKSKKIIRIFLVVYAIATFLLNVATLISSSSNNFKAWSIAYGVVDGLFLLTIITNIIIKVYLKEFNKKDIFIYLLMSCLLFSGIMSNCCIWYISTQLDVLATNKIPAILSTVYWLSLVGNGISVLFSMLFLLSEYNVFKNKSKLIQNKELNEAVFGSIE